MLNRQEIKAYRELRGLSQTDVARFSQLPGKDGKINSVDNTLICKIEAGAKPMTENAYHAILDAINRGYQARKKGLHFDFREQKEEMSEGANNEPMPIKIVKKAKKKKKTKTED